MKEVTIDNQKIGGHNQIYLIAEIGGNFVDFQTAKIMIDLAIKAGVNAIKLQHYKAETITIRSAMFEMENTGITSQYDLFKKYELSEKLTSDVFSYCREKEITVFSTPSHQTDVELLEKLDVPAYKIGSDDAVNLPFLKFLAKIGKPILLSTGMCTIREVQLSVETILEEGNDQLILLHCVTNYPAHINSINLRAMQTMKNFFNFPVGYSDHAIGIDVCYAAAVLGASILEFHFTYNKQAQGPDHMLSKNFEETETLIKKLRELPVLMGDGIKRPAVSEMNTRRNNRKSIVIVKDIKANEKITDRNIDIKRPGYGIPCEYYYNVLGKTVSRDINADQVLTWDVLL